MVMGSGLLEYVCFDTFSCIIIYNVKIVDRIVIDHVDVSSCGISLRGGLCSHSLT